ncbi:GSCOCG00009554001-RA-CDS [Cotesia congregata]|nr:GSCOCG00009554001-RA-CDS [Cotesia congregata]
MSHQRYMNIKHEKNFKCNVGLKVRTWYLGILGFLIASLIIINNFITNQFNSSIDHFANVSIQDNFIEREQRKISIVTNTVLGFIVHKQGCQIAELDPFNEFAKHFMETENPLECEFGNQLPLVESNDTAIFINPDAHNQYYNETEVVADCCWRIFERKKNQDNFVKYDPLCHKFNSSTTITAEFIKVECFKNSKQIYRDYHFFVPRKPIVEERCHAAEKKRKEERKKHETEKDDNNNDNHLSILILGLDSVSRMNFHRMMPKTIETLKSMGAIEMMGYNKIGDNTYPNLVSVLSGLSEKEFRSNCWNNSKLPFDKCPLIWKNFSKSGYRTIFAEDACAMTTFNYLKPGFRNQPTDYYFRPYCLAAESDIGNTHKLNADLCIGTRKTFDNLLNYTKKVVREFNGDRYFAFFWEASLTHDFFNYPQLGDLPYSESISYLHNQGFLNNTVLIVMSDHGMRWGEFRQTYQGRIEGSLPLMFIILPEWWKKKFPLAVNNLKQNTVSLTTPYDFHETLMDFLHPENLTDQVILSRINKNMPNDKNNSSFPRGISWFLTIPDKRNCSMAGIPGHWCMCHKSTNISHDDSAVKNAADFIINELNTMVNKKYPQCSLLKLSKVIDAKVWSAHGVEKDKDEERSVPWIDYTISIKTIPSNAIFEATVRHDNTGNSTIVGSIGRLNSYGKQSTCVDDFNMRLYCYCG